MTTKLPPPSQGPDPYIEWKKCAQLVKNYRARLTSMLGYISRLELRIEELEKLLTERPNFGHKTNGEPKE
jgi:hypothetical protein